MSRSAAQGGRRFQHCARRGDERRSLRRKHFRDFWGARGLELQLESGTLPTSCGGRGPIVDDLCDQFANRGFGRLGEQRRRLLARRALERAGTVSFKPVTSAKWVNVETTRTGMIRVQIEHETIRRVTPEMMRWWFENLSGSTTWNGIDFTGPQISHYHLWHHRDHLAVTPVQLRNCVEFVAVVYGILRVDAILVFALPAHRYADISYFVERTDAVAYLVADEVADFDYLDLARRIIASGPTTLRHVLVHGDAHELTPLADVDADPIDLAPADPADVATADVGRYHRAAQAGGTNPRRLVLQWPGSRRHVRLQRGHSAHGLSAGRAQLDLDARSCWRPFTRVAA